MREPIAVWESIRNLFLDFQWITAVIAVFLLAIIVYVICVLWRNNGKRCIPIYLLFLLIAGGISLFLADRTVAVVCFFVFFVGITVFFLLLYTTEIKRSIYNANKHIPHRASTPVKATVAMQRAEELTSLIVRAVQNLSKNNIGALIVFSNGNLPKEVVDSGVLLNANISNQLIEGIFIPKAPLHDGAMIIYGDKIQAAGCFLPLTGKDYPKEYGTRHRAGIGITEVADVATIIVSEETGIVSTVHRGKIDRFVDSAGLKKFLKDYYWKEYSGEARK